MRPKRMLGASPEKGKGSETRLTGKGNLTLFKDSTARNLEQESNPEHAPEDGGRPDRHDG